MGVHSSRYTEIDKSRVYLYTGQKWQNAAKKAENVSLGTNRRARRWGARGRLFSQDILRLYNAARWRCIYCGKRCQCSDMTVDHVRPLSQGGTNDMDNVVPACAWCNHQKSDKPIQQWLDEIGISTGEFLRRWFDLRARVLVVNQFIDQN